MTQRTLLFFPSPLNPRCQGRVLGFVGGGSNIAIATALPPSFCVSYCKHQTVYGFIYLIFCAYVRLRFLDVETNHGPRRPVPAVCRIYCCNVRRLAGNLSDMAVVSSRYEILLCSESLVLDMRHVSELLVPGFDSSVLLCQGRMPLARGMAHTYKMDMEHFANPTSSVVIVKCCY